MSGLFVRPIDVPLAAMEYVPSLQSSWRAVAGDDSTECPRSGMPTDFAISCCCAPCEGVGRISRWLARDKVGCE